MLSTHRFVQHRARAIVALLALAIVALVLAACGGSDSSNDSGGSGSSADAETLLRQTFTGDHEIRSGRADVNLRVDVAGSPSVRGPITAHISGPFESAGTGEPPKFDLALDVHAQGQGFEAGLTSTSDRLFVNFGGTAYEVPADVLNQLKDRFRRAQQQKQGSSPQMSLQSFGLDPLSWLQDPTVEGSETVGGVETDHVSAQLDVGALLDDFDKVLARARAQGLPNGQQLPNGIPESTRRQVEDAVKSASIDIWSGQDDHTLRRLDLALNVVPPAGANGPRSIDIALSIELDELNQPQSIEAPATTRPLNELLGQLQGFLGGALGGGALGGAGSSGGASSDQLDAYSACIQRAGSDVAEAQKCADLLTK